jgi:hypothetical protein
VSKLSGGVHSTTSTDPMWSFATAIQEYFKRYSEMPQRVIVPIPLMPVVMEALVKLCHCRGCVIHDPDSREICGVKITFDPSLPHAHKWGDESIYRVEGGAGVVEVVWA